MFNSIGVLFSLIYLMLLKGGWVLLVIALVYMFYKLYMDFIQIRWYDAQKWVYLNITAPKENEKSPLAFEQIFNQLHALHVTFTAAEKYLEGQIQIWFTWEVVGIGGTISNYVKILKKHRNTLEAAIYSQFPDAEITETEDYFDKLPRYNAETSEFDIFAFSLKMQNDESYPIRTYRDFEHPTADTFADPVTGLWEELGKLSPYEMFIVQYLFRPVDDEWKKKGYNLVKKLKGVPKAKGGGAESFLEEFISEYIAGPIADFFIRPSSWTDTKKYRNREEPPSLMLHLTEGEKGVINAIEIKLSKLGYKTKIRCMYLAPREKFNPSPVYTAVIGSIKSVKGTNINGIKPDTDHWSKVKYWVNRDWEKSILKLRTHFRNRRFWNMIRKRFFLWGRAGFVLNSEEIATILHFPTIEVTVPRIEKVTVTKVQPPPELPIAP